MTDVRGARRQYAAFVAALGASGDQRIEAAFAAVERERHCGDALWLVAAGEGYVRRPSPDPDFLYRNAAIGLVPERGLNNGEPGSHALWLKAVEPKAGECVAHFGAGAGYYTAILADCANVFVHTRSGAAGALPGVDVMYVNAGATAPMAVWLDALRLDGRLIFPLTPDVGIGGTLHVGRAPMASIRRALIRAPCSSNATARETPAKLRGFQRRSRAAAPRMYAGRVGERIPTHRAGLPTAAGGVQSKPDAPASVRTRAPSPRHPANVSLRRRSLGAAARAGRIRPLART
jgi:protein-L-isoaspartate(D-aspartate) O-methyltransferase